MSKILDFKHCLTCSVEYWGKNSNTVRKVLLQRCHCYFSSDKLLLVTIHVAEPPEKFKPLTKSNTFQILNETILQESSAQFVQLKSPSFGQILSKNF